MASNWVSNFNMAQVADEFVAPAAPRIVSRQLGSGERLKLTSVCENAVIPRLTGRRVGRLPAVPIIDPHSDELAHLLVGANPQAALALIDSLRSDHRSLGTLCAELLEPAARALYELWKSDDCTEFDVTLALDYLQIALHHASLDAASPPSMFTSPSVPAFAAPDDDWPLQQSVLVAPSPKEPHMLGSMIASKLFWRAGWQVSCEFPTSDEALGALVHDHWYDVLELSLSSTFLREHRLAALAKSIRAAHAHSRNPGMVVIVDGRVFHDRPQAFMEVGADASNANALDIVATAQAHAAKAHLPA